MKTHLIKNTTPKMKLLVATRSLPPLIGGMEHLSWHIADELGLK